MTLLRKVLALKKNKKNSKAINNYILLIITVACLAVGIFPREYISNGIEKNSLAEATAPGVDSRVLIIAPHCDDEVLGAGDLIEKTLENKGSVKVVVITNGDANNNAVKSNSSNGKATSADYIKLGYARQQETIQALKDLGLSEKDIVFLGYPDQGLSSMLTLDWDKSTPYLSRYTNSDQSPYCNSMDQSVAYAGENLLSELKTIIEAYKPTHVVYPHPSDEHPDHESTYAFVKLALTELDDKAQNEWLYLIHSSDWPTSLKENSEMSLVPPTSLIGTGTNWYVLYMNDLEIKKKTEAIQAYQTQLKANSKLLTSFETKNELFGIYPDIQLRKGLLKDADIQPVKDNKIIIDESDDATSRKINKGVAIANIYSEISTENDLNLFIETATGTAIDANYKLNIFFLNKDTSKRMNLVIQGNTLSKEVISQSSIEGIGNTSVKSENGYIRVIIPLSESYDHLFINAQSQTGGNIYDQTAWRMCSLTQ